MEIFTELGVNQSLGIQFALFTLLFLIMKVLFIGNLNEISHLKLDKTGSEDEAIEHIQTQAKLMQQTVQAEVQATQEQIQDRVAVEKKAFKREYENAVKSAEEKLSGEYADYSQKLNEQVQQAQKQIDQEKNKLTELLISKIS